MVEKVVAHCDKIFCLNSDLVRFVPGAEFLPYCNAERPGETLPVPRVSKAGERPVVIHAPTNRSIKGTRFLEAASAALQKTVPHELVMIEGVSRERALEMYARADVAVDQVLVGWYGGFAVEAMRAGLPVISYINSRFLNAIPEKMAGEIPIARATPETLADTLADLLTHRETRASLGERGRAYADRWHDPLRIAKRMLELYEEPRGSFWDGYHPEAPPVD